MGRDFGVVDAAARMDLEKLAAVKQVLAHVNADKSKTVILQPPCTELAGFKEQSRDSVRYENDVWKVLRLLLAWIYRQRCAADLM